MQPPISREPAEIYGKEDRKRDREYPNEDPDVVADGRCGKRDGISVLTLLTERGDDEEQCQAKLPSHERVHQSQTTQPEVRRGSQYRADQNDLDRLSRHHAPGK